MIASIELQVISRILTSQSQEEISKLCEFDESYYSVFKEHIEFILNHKYTYGDVPDVFTFQAKFPDVTLVDVRESFEYLSTEMRRNKKNILLVETFNKIKDLGSDDVDDAWKYLSSQCERVEDLNPLKPMDIVADAKQRSDQIIEFGKQTRIPTGFPEIDKLMYGGLSTVEELVLIIARTSTGKSWICTRMMESAQGHGFPVLYYSPEMQASYLGTRFDTWRKHFSNSQLYKGEYDEEYYKYIDELSKEQTPAYVLEDKNVDGGSVNTRIIEQFVKKHGIKLVIIDGLSYMEDVRSKYSDRDYEKYRNICMDLFNKVSKKYGCAVVVVMQANRETQNNKDEKGEPFPNLYNSEGSDHPARICTQAFAVRQLFDKHVLEIRLEKSRTANNSKPVIAYSWDINTGRITLVPNSDDIQGDAIDAVLASPTVETRFKAKPHNDSSLLEDDEDDDGEEVEF